MLTSYSGALVSLSLLKVFVASMSSLVRRSSSFFLRLNLIRFLTWYFPSLLSMALRISFKSPDSRWGSISFNHLTIVNLVAVSLLTGGPGTRPPILLTISPKEVSHLNKRFSVWVIASAKISTKLFSYVTPDKTCL